jgi:hypothetical protein
MQALNIEATKSSPKIKFEPEEQKLTIKGESYPEDSFSFYEEIFDLMERAVDKYDEFELEIEVSYLNTSSTKSFMTLLDIAEQAHQEGDDIQVVWYYQEDNEHSYELALDFKSYLELPFDIIAK